MQPMKEGIDRAAVDRIGIAFQQCWPDFPLAAFKRGLVKQLQPLELKQRVELVCERLARQLPSDFETLSPILHELPHHWNFGEPDNALRGFAAWPVIDLVPRCGIEHPTLALPLLARLTHLFTAEFAVRPFIARYPQQSLGYLENCCDSPDEHIRRWASEGSRPLLPWGMHLVEIRDNPHMTASLLEKLRKDPSKYVQKSVANHLNDVGKHHPDHLVATCTRWLKEEHPNSNWICKHALRTRLKLGDSRVFPLLGFDNPDAVEVSQLQLSANPAKNELAMALQLVNPSKKRVKFRLDYGLELPRSGDKKGYFVFRWGEHELDPSESISLQGKHSFRPLSTRRYYPGHCRLDIRLNGKVREQADFVLDDSCRVNATS